jgi:hypothetical protein
MIDTDLKSTSGKTPRGWLRPIQTEIAAWSREDPASRVLAAVLFMFALFMLWSMAVIQRRGYSALPWWDMWDYWVWYLKPHPAPLLNLFAQHNEHRIAVARLFFLADQGFFQGRAIFIFVSIFLIQFCHAILLWRLAYLAHPHRKTLSVFLGSAALLCLFSAEQYTNFTWSFQIQFVVVYFAVTGALTSLLVFARLCDEGAATNESRRWFWLGIAILVGIIATYSMANGLLVWPVLLLLALWFRLPRPVKGVLLLVGVAMWTLYLWGYKSPPQTSSIRDGFHNLPQSFVFAMCVLGSPLNDFVFEIDRIFSMGGEQWQLVWTAAAGLIGFTASALLWIVFGRNRRDTSRADAVILHLLLFLVATTALIGLGRSNAPLRDALHSRYTTVGLLFWFCIFFLCASLIVRRSRSQDSQSLVLFQFAGAMLALVVIVLYQPTQIRFARENALDLSEYEATIGAPVYDPDLWDKSYYNPRGLIPILRYMQTKHLSVFAPERSRWLGDPIAAHYRAAASDDCVGSLDSNVKVFVDPELPGFRLRGWAWSPQSRRIAGSVVVTDKQGRILGFGYTGFDRPDVRAARPDVGPAVGWIAYIPDLGHDSVAAYMVAKDGSSACLIGARELAQSPGVSVSNSP